MDIKKIPPPEKDRYCGNCIFYKMRSSNDPGEWVKPWVCKNEKANPDKKDPKDENLNLYYRKACQHWGW